MTDNEESLGEIITLGGELLSSDTEGYKMVEEMRQILRRERTTALFINSAGGDLYTGFNIGDVVSANGEVWGIVTGRCDSAAVYILASCAVKVVTPEASIFLHSIEWHPSIKLVEVCRLLDIMKK